MVGDVTTEERGCSDVRKGHEPRMKVASKLKKSMEVDSPLKSPEGAQTCHHLNGNWASRTVRE